MQRNVHGLLQAGVYPNVVDAAGSICKACGPRGLFTGYLPTLLEDVPDMACKFAAYETLRSLHRSFVGGRKASATVSPPKSHPVSWPAEVWLCRLCYSHVFAEELLHAALWYSVVLEHALCWYCGGIPEAHSLDALSIRSCST